MAYTKREEMGYGREVMQNRRPPAAVPHDAGGGMVWPRNEAELRQALQSAADERYVVMLDPRTHVAIQQTITIQQEVCDGSVWGVNGNWAKIDWAGDWEQDMLVFRGVKGMANRGLFIEKLSLFGNGYAGARCGSCLKLLAPEGDPGAIYRFTLRDIASSYGTHGVSLVGAIFEGLLDNVHTENHSSDGIHMENTYVPGEHQGIVSNVMMVAPNSSRNLGAGIHAVQSVNMILGSFVNNAHGGVVAPDGLRAAALCNGENTGEALFVVPSVGWGSDVTMNVASTNGVLAAAKWEDGQWVTVGKPMFYLLDDAGSGVPQARNRIAYYGDGTNADEIQVVKPA